MKMFIILFALIFAALICSPLQAQDLTTTTSTLFSGSGNCAICHIAGTSVLTTQAGIDISPTSLWRSTMMGNASKDPLWQAKVTAEVDAHPALQSIIEDKCTTCHAPLGRTEAVFTGSEYFSFSEALSDPLSLDGVSCTLCHQIQSANLGTEASFSGKYEIGSTHEIFGPYTSPTTAPMFNQTGFTPTYSTHVNESWLCATCHTLFTPFVDNDGQVAGYFPEQTPYLEWENSDYPSQSITCQTCHMPATEESMVISISPPWLTTLRSPIWAHDFVGGNTFLNTIFKTHSAEIGVAATGAHLDSTFSKMNRLLTEKTVALSADVNIENDTLNAKVLVENLSGHKFPTGFPSRRAWLNLQIKNSSEQIIFESGNWAEETGEITGIDANYEPHHTVITDENEVQIYESIMQDVDGEVTYTLLRGAEYAKDNRLPPKGFKTSATGYETVAVFGNAVNDENFNHTDTGAEGSGSDQVEYKYSVANEGTDFTVTANLYYQTITPRFAADIFTHQTDKITKFYEYYNQASKTPVLLKSISIPVTNTTVPQISNLPSTKFELLHNFPNPFNPTTQISFILYQSDRVILKIYNTLGKEIETLIDDYKTSGKHEISFNAKYLPSGIYFYQLKGGSQTKTRQMLLLK